METSASSPLWIPSPEAIGRSNLTRYQQWLEKNLGLKFDDYAALWEWSTKHPEKFWSSLADFFEVRFHDAPDKVLSSFEMPGAHWFPGATLNYAEHALRLSGNDQEIVLIARAETRNGKVPHEEISRAELRRRVAAIATALRRTGVQAGDRVVGYLPNIPESVVAFLAAASIGAVWSNCPVEMSSRSVLDRFVQIEPKVLFSITGYQYGNKPFDRQNTLLEITAGLPTLQHVILIDTETIPEIAAPCSLWKELENAPGIPDLVFDPVPFEHPLWILYSSGTTGLPKAIVQGHGGILLEHLKALSLHLDLQTGDRFFWYTTSGWMMWNFLVSGLLLPGLAIVLYEGSPKYPDFNVLWDLIESLDISYFGTSAPYLVACMKEGLEPGKRSPLKSLRGIGSTGAPLPAEGFSWVYENVKRDLLLGSVSGGTDVCTAFVLSNPHLPVYAGKIQCLGLGAKIEAWTDQREPLLGQMGELVLTIPFPSMPVSFWNDPDNKRLYSSYYEKFPGVWAHGDWIEIESPGGSCVIYGRSDATLNRGGVRMGTSDFYAIVEALPEIAEALVIDTGGLGQKDQLLLFIVLQPGCVLDEALRARINQRLRSEVSPRHVPDAIHAIPEIPRTLNGKKLEVPIKRILTGMPVEKAVNRSTVANPDVLQYFIDFPKTSGNS